MSPPTLPRTPFFDWVRFLTPVAMTLTMPIIAGLIAQVIVNMNDVTRLTERLDASDKTRAILIAQYDQRIGALESAELLNRTRFDAVMNRFASAESARASDAATLDAILQRFEGLERSIDRLSQQRDSELLLTPGRRVEIPR